ncbi:MAG: AbrB/MazE/SpoVT family DNA-binding domain-containing protein [Chloroflexi bacterium]|nr:AbrB/MazE/SpoVT family DNA-binding domain-containing protein [Chloroflexota bacterium]
MTLPAAIRKQLRLFEGDIFIARVEGRQIVFELMVDALWRSGSYDRSVIPPGVLGSEELMAERREEFRREEEEMGRQP